MLLLPTRTNVRIPRAVMAVFLTIATVLAMIAIAAPAHAAGATYYVNNQTGSNCSNTSSGTSSSAPWCDFTNANAKTFQPGDQLLLARGATWYQRLDLHGSGTSTDWITVDAYGSGARPVIRGNHVATDRTVSLYDGSYWNIRNLELSYAGEGVLLYYTTTGNQGINLENLFIHDIDLIITNSPAQSDFSGLLNGSYAVYIFGPATFTTSDFVLKDVDMSNIVANNVTGGITPAIGYAGGNNGSGSIRPNGLQNITIRDCDLSNVKWVALSFANASNINVIGCRVSNAATVALSQGTTAGFGWQASNVTFANSVIINTPNTGSADQSGVDSEAWNDQWLFRGNYFGANAGAGIEFLSLSGRTGDYNTNHEISSNAFVGNQESVKMINNGGAPMSGTIRDNLYAEPGGFITGPTSGWTVNNNMSAAGLYHGGFDYSSVQNTGGASCTSGSNCWSYQSLSGTYAGLSYDSTSSTWTGANGSIGRSSQTPSADPGTWTARAWTAPTAGTIAIRGRVLKDAVGGDGVQTRITKNGAVIWPTSGSPAVLGGADRVGFDTNLSGVVVSAGDIIRFEVNNGGSGNTTGDMTSWTPAVAYSGTSSPTNVAPIATVTSSSQYDSTTYSRDRAVDGSFSQYGGEWAALNEVNPWLQLTWSSAQTINEIDLFDRIQTDENVNAGTLTFSDGSSIAVTGVPINGAVKAVTFAAKTVTWVKFQVTGGAGVNVGLGEIRALT